MARALDPKQAFSGAMTHALVRAVNEKLSDPATHIPPAEIARGVIAIMQNRIADETAAAALLRDPQFLQSIDTLKTGITQGDLPAGKVEEIARRFVQPNDEAGAEPPIHVTAGAIGHHVLHYALAQIFEPSHGPLVAPLTQEIVAQSPGINPQRAELLARGWLNDRFVAARGVTNTTAPDGEAHQLALQQAEQHIAIKHGLAPSPQVQAPVPSVAIDPAAKGNAYGT